MGREAPDGSTPAIRRAAVAGGVSPRSEGTARASDDRPGGHLGTRVTRKRGSAVARPRAKTPRDRAKLVLRVSTYQRCIAAPSGGVRTLSVPEQTTERTERTVSIRMIDVSRRHPAVVRHFLVNTAPPVLSHETVIMVSAHNQIASQHNYILTAPSVSM